MKDINREQGHKLTSRPTSFEPLAPPIEQVNFDSMLRLLERLETRTQADRDTQSARHDTEPLRGDAVALAADRQPTSGPDEQPGFEATVSDVIDFSYAAHSLFDDGFDWPSWANSQYTQTLLGQLHTGDASQLTLEDARKILFALARNNRFCDGAIKSSIDSGLVHTILHRVRELTKEN